MINFKNLNLVISDGHASSTPNEDCWHSIYEEFLQVWRIIFNFYTGLSHIIAWAARTLKAACLIVWFSYLAPTLSLHLNMGAYYVLYSLQKQMLF